MTGDILTDAGGGKAAVRPCLHLIDIGISIIYDQFCSTVEIVSNKIIMWGFDKFQ